MVVGGVFGRVTGGAEKQAGLLAEGLSRRGHVVDVVAKSATDGADRGRWPWGCVSSYEGGRRHRLLEVREVTRAIEAVETDVVYERGMSTLTIGARNAARNAGVGFVFAAASDADFESVGQRWRRAYRQRTQDGAGKRPITASVGAFLDGLTHHLALHAARKADAVVAQTETQRDALIARLRLSPSRVIVSRSLVPEDFACPSGPRDAVLWVGSDKPVKQPWLFRRIAEHGPDAFEYVMAGVEPEAAQAYTCDRMHVLGSLSNDEVMRLMAGSIVYVSTSAAEGFPNTFLEAWSCGTPVLTLGLDPDGIIAKHGLGWVAQDTEEAVGILESVAADRAAAVDAGKRARCYVDSMRCSSTSIVELESVLVAASSRSVAAGRGAG